MREVDEISDEDLVAASEIYNSIVSGKNPYQQAIEIAQTQFGVCIKGHRLLDRIMSTFATSPAPIEGCVNHHLRLAGYSRLVD
jgi:hypothetical protein